MKLLHFSDLHAHKPHLAALLRICQEEQPDVVAITGDITLWADSPETDRPRLKIVQTFMEELNKKVPVVFCSGNHEAWTYKQNVKEFALACTDNQTVLLNGWIFSSFPWANGGFATKLLTQEATLRKENPSAPIVWLHHEPALGSACAWNGFSSDGNFLLQHHIREYKPTYVLSGHIHGAPFIGGKAIERMFGTTCCNPGSSATIEGEHYTQDPPYIGITDTGVTWIQTAK